MPKANPDKSAKSNEPRKDCVKCSINFCKLKELCELKGIQTSFTARLPRGVENEAPATSPQPKPLSKSAAKSKKRKITKIVRVHNRCKCKKMIKHLEKSLVNAIVKASKTISRPRRKTPSQKTRILNFYKLDQEEFQVEDEQNDENHNDVSSELQFQIPIITISDSDINITNGQQVAAAKAPYHENIEGSDEDRASNHSDCTIIFAKPYTPRRKFSQLSQTNVLKYEHVLKKVCDNKDSMGLLGFTQNESYSDDGRIAVADKVKAWTEYGFPYVDELPGSQYDLLEEERSRKHGLNSLSISPILL